MATVAQLAAFANFARAVVFAQLATPAHAFPFPMCA